MTALNRWLLVLVVLVLAWKGLTAFVTYWANREAQEQQRDTFNRIMRANEPPRASGLRQDSRKVGR